MKGFRLLTISFIVAIVGACEVPPKDEVGLTVTPELITSDFECQVNAPLEKVFASLADVVNHDKILSNIVSRTVVDPSALESVLGKNEILTVSTVVEPEERLALALFRLYPPNRVEEEMLTDPFDNAGETQDRKKGSIAWSLEKSDRGTRVTVHSEFAPRTGRVYSAERINRIWSSHCELLEADANSR